MEHKVTHFLYTPFTGLGLFLGHRGKRWLRNRIQIFKQFVVPSLLAQTNKEFTLWISWRFEDRDDLSIKALESWLQERGLKTVFTYSGVCFYDDKYSDNVAYDRLVDAIHNSLGELHNVMGEADTILMTIQPSDDLYDKHTVDGLQRTFREVPDLQAVGYTQGYVMDYTKGTLAEWNPNTIPPFFTIKFPRETFIDPLKHVEYTGPYKSHEYIADKLRFGTIKDVRGFLVGTHGENISTTFNHPFTGREHAGEERDRVLDLFGIRDVPPLVARTSWRRALMRRLPHGWQRKLRYWAGERFYQRIYQWIRS